MSELAGLPVEGGTALYATVRAAHRELLDRYDPQRINAIVVLTDGINEHRQDNDLDRIAKASSDKAFDATDPAKIDKAFVKLVSSC